MATSDETRMERLESLGIRIRKLDPPPYEVTDDANAHPQSMTQLFFDRHDLGAPSTAAGGPAWARLLDADLGGPY